MDITIKDFSETHALCTVIKNGRQYSTTWAKEYDEEGKIISPTKEEVKEAFKNNRKHFDPYSVARGY